VGHSRQGLGGGEPATVAIIGGGCAGTLVAANLLRGAGGPLRITLIERGASFGPGVAYSTQDAGHLLNVPAARMSAFAEQPLHFAEWAAQRLGRDAPEEFLPRRLYGEYLESVLERSRIEASPGRTLELVHGEVRGLRRCGARIELALAEGAAIRCDRAVLATGPLAGDPPLELPDDERIIRDPLVAGALRPAAPGGLALVVGTGLTGVDAMLSLSARGGRVAAISRAGCLPQTHLPGLRDPAPPPLVPRGSLSLAAVERLLTDHFREMASIGYDWRDAIDGLRPVTAQLWSALATRHRRRFLHARRRAWETRRHRMAPSIGRRLGELRGAGMLETMAGELLDVRAEPAALRVTLAVGGSRTLRELSCERLVLCTGPGLDIRAVADPLLCSLLSEGLASTDPLGLGLRTGADGALRDHAGRAGGEILTLGALRRGELWETTAVDPIRVQARSVAEAIEGSLERRGRLRPAVPASSADGSALDQTTGLFAMSTPKPTEVEQ